MEINMYEYPKDLIDYLTEQESEGNEIFTTTNEDGTVWFIIPNGLKKWIVMVERYEGQNKFSTVNICAKAFDRLHKIMHECEGNTCQS
jgi:hypothetical protein